MDIKSLVDQPSKLPNIPEVMKQLIDSFSREDVSVDEITRQLAADPALVAKLLRLANSAYFHVSRTIGTADDALRMLGFVMVRNLVLGNGMVAAFRNTPGMNLKEFWRHSLYTACTSRWLSGIAAINGDETFTVGLMHGIGQLQMHVVAPAAMAPLDKEMDVLDLRRAAVEKERLGFHFGEVGAEMAKLWNFPRSIIVALNDVPDPLAAESFSEVAGIVHLAAWYARAEMLGWDDEQITQTYPAEVADRLGIEQSWIPVFAKSTPDPTLAVVPPLNELAEGLDAMLD